MWICFTDLIEFNDGSVYTDLKNYSYSGVHYRSNLELNYYGYATMKELEDAEFARLGEEWKMESRDEAPATTPDECDISATIQKKHSKSIWGCRTLLIRRPELRDHRDLQEDKKPVGITHRYLQEDKKPEGKYPPVFERVKMPEGITHRDLR